MSGMSSSPIVASYSGWLTLSVGGEKISTRVATLCAVSGSRMEEMIRTGSGCMQDSDGVVQIDYDPGVFAILLHYLRTERLILRGYSAKDIREECLTKLCDDVLSSERVAAPSVIPVCANLQANDDRRHSIANAPSAEVSGDRAPDSTNVADDGSLSVSAGHQETSVLTDAGPKVEVGTLGIVASSTDTRSTLQHAVRELVETAQTVRAQQMDTTSRSASTTARFRQSAALQASSVHINGSMHSRPTEYRLNQLEAFGSRQEEGARPTENGVRESASDESEQAIRTDLHVDSDAFGMNMQRFVDTASARRNARPSQRHNAYRGAFQFAAPAAQNHNHTEANAGYQAW